jgi:hypothetical protein
MLITNPRAAGAAALAGPLVGGKLGYDAGAGISDYLLKESSAEEKKAGLSRVLTAIPGIGGAMHGLIDPVEGSPRGTSLMYEGTGGLLGSILGGVGGSLALRDRFDQPGVGGLLGGSALGSALGSHLGRWLAETKDDGEVEELRKLVEALGKQQIPQGGVTVNVGPTEAASTGFVIEEA